MGCLSHVPASLPLRAVMLRIRHGSGRALRSSKGQSDGNLAVVAMPSLGEGWTRSRGQNEARQFERTGSVPS